MLEKIAAERGFPRVDGSDAAYFAAAKNLPPVIQRSLF
jgi:hypothetical protein